MGQKIEVGVRLGTCKAVDRHDVPDDWESMSDEEQQKYLDELAEAHVGNEVSAWATIVEDDE